MSKAVHKYLGVGKISVIFLESRQIRVRIFGFASQNKLVDEDNSVVVLILDWALFGNQLEQYHQGGT